MIEVSKSLDIDLAGINICWCILVASASVAIGDEVQLQSLRRREVQRLDGNTVEATAELVGLPVAGNTLLFRSDRVRTSVGRIAALENLVPHAPAPTFLL